MFYVSNRPSSWRVMERKETPFTHLQYMGQSVPPPRIVMLGTSHNHGQGGGANLNVPLPTSHLKL